MNDNRRAIMCIHVAVEMLYLQVSIIFYLLFCHSCNVQCSPAQFYSMVKALVRVQREVESFSEMALNELHSDLVLQTIKQVTPTTTAISSVETGSPPLLLPPSLPPSSLHARFPLCSEAASSFWMLCVNKLQGTCVQ